MTYVEANLEKIFNITFRYNDYRSAPYKGALKNFTIIETIPENYTLKFECKFEWPFQFGLLTTKNDTLFFTLTTDTAIINPMLTQEWRDSIDRRPFLF